jgi:hypothetical protein
MPNIRWIEDDQATGELAKIYEAWKQANPGRASMPGILKCFSPRPDFLRSVIEFSYSLHFSDGFLNRRQKEMIATLVSGLNQCPY